MTFSELSNNYQENICYSIHGLQMDELTGVGRDNLEVLTPYEMFDALLTYEGICGYTDFILHLHEILFKGEN